MEYALNWELLLSTHRLGSASRSPLTAGRTQFIRDYDRLIFSSPFRRLQNKTQVFPLPGSVFVHNRLTHSLEVASVGRSLGNLLAAELEERGYAPSHTLYDWFGSIVSAACLAHDLGNPPFGHSGEKAISRFFEIGAGKELQSAVSPTEWLDLTHFEGNANAFRVLTHRFNGRREGGFALTYSTLAALVKYPYGSDAMPVGKNKYGFFTSEKATFIDIAEAQHLLRLSEQPLRYCRHPLVYLVEAADDITYQVMDVEDAHKLKILSYDETCNTLSAFWEPSDPFFTAMNKIFKTVTDRNERVSYLRAMLINKLVNECVTIFINNYTEIMNGVFTGSLVDALEGASKAGLDDCRKLSYKQIYNHTSVVEVELAGYRILGALLDDFVDAAMNPDSHFAGKLLALLPEQYRTRADATVYERLQSSLDFVSGMTDLFAVDLYRTIHGIKG